MTRLELVGLDGSNPLGFLAALGIVRIIPDAKLGFCDDGSFRAYIESNVKSESDLATLIADDAIGSASESAPWRFTYTKPATKRKGPLKVADLKSPPEDFKVFLTNSIEAWLTGNDDPVSYAAAYGTDVAVDHKGNTKPMAFHFTAANQTFLGSVEGTRSSITKEWVEVSLFEGHGDRPGSNLRWDPGAERNWALMANNPSGDGTRVDAPLEWLAFRGLPLLPSFPIGSSIMTTGVVGRGDSMTFTWPLWSVPASMHATRSSLQLDWTERSREGLSRGVFAICTSAIRRTGQGFGNFGPSTVVC